MKHISVLAISAITTIGVIPFCSHAAPISYKNANGIAVHNIAAMQHSAMLNTFDNFDGSLSVAFIGKPYSKSQTKTPADEPATSDKDAVDNYGKMPTYGEYGDDGTVFLRGRSGGEQNMNGTAWVDWHHASGDAKFKKSDPVESRYNVVSFGFSAKPTELSGGYSAFGGFGGVMLGHEDADTVKLDENGQYIGIYGGYHKHNLNLHAAANVGTMFSDADTIYGDYDLTHAWFGAAANVSYDIMLDATSVLQPGLYAGYTWIHSDANDFNNHNISFSDFNAFELSPSLRAISLIGNDWYGVMFARYVFNFTSGGTPDISGEHISELDQKDYGEYGVSLEKTIDSFGFSVSVARRDGGRSGWFGGLHLRYLF